mgnify:CR=1 FL=1
MNFSNLAPKVSSLGNQSENPASIFSHGSCTNFLAKKSDFVQNNELEIQSTSPFTISAYMADNNDGKMIPEDGANNPNKDVYWFETNSEPQAQIMPEQVKEDQEVAKMQYINNCNTSNLEQTINMYETKQKVQPQPTVIFVNLAQLWNPKPPEDDPEDDLNEYEEYDRLYGMREESVELNSSFNSE